VRVVLFLIVRVVLKTPVQIFVAVASSVRATAQLQFPKKRIYEWPQEGHRQPSRPNAAACRGFLPLKTGVSLYDLLHGSFGQRHSTALKVV